jgi:hypothetical protein
MYHRNRMEIDRAVLTGLGGKKAGHILNHKHWHIKVLS